MICHLFFMIGKKHDWQAYVIIDVLILATTFWNSKLLSCTFHSNDLKNDEIRILLIALLKLNNKYNLYQKI